MTRLSIQSKLGISGIVASLIWIAAKFGLFTISENQWICVSGIIFSFIIFYHFLGTEKKSTVLISILIFFYSITLLIYFLQTEEINNRLNFDFNFIIYASSFAFGAFLIALTFFEKLISKSRMVFVSLLLISSSILVLFLKPQVYEIYFLQKSISFIEEYLDIVISILILSLLIFPLKEIIKSFNKTKKMSDDASLT